MTVVIIPSFACNFRCKYCYLHNSTKLLSKILSAEFVCDFLRQLHMTTWVMMASLLEPTPTPTSQAVCSPSQALESRPPPTTCIFTTHWGRASPSESWKLETQH